MTYQVTANDTVLFMRTRVDIEADSEKEALEKLRQQYPTLRPIEIMCVDDTSEKGSTS